MADRMVYDFVSEYFPEHKSYWDCLSEAEKDFFNHIPYSEVTLKNAFFAPEENQQTVKHLGERVHDLEMILSHRECVFDYFLFKRLSSQSYAHLGSIYSFIFEEPEKYAVPLKEYKTIKSSMEKVYEMIPPYYKEYEKSDNKRQNCVFGKFYKKLDKVTFQSGFDNVTFNRSQLNLIPFFINYRKKYFLEWSFEIFSYQEEDKNFMSDWSNYKYHFYGLHRRVEVMKDFIKKEQYLWNSQ